MHSNENCSQSLNINPQLKVTPNVKRNRRWICLTVSYLVTDVQLLCQICYE